MSEPTRHRDFSEDVVELIIDGDKVGDTTVRPCPPHRRAFLEAWRDKIQHWKAWRKQQQQEQSAQASPPDPDEGG